MSDNTAITPPIWWFKLLRNYVILPNSKYCDCNHAIVQPTNVNPPKHIKGDAYSPYANQTKRINIIPN